MSVISIKLDIHGFGELPKSTSSLVNELFGKSFKIHGKSNIDHGTLELQYDHDCENTDYLVVADAHGQLAEDEIPPLATIFDYLIIHVLDDQKCAENETLKTVIEKIKKLNKHCKILVVAHD